VPRAQTALQEEPSFGDASAGTSRSLTQSFVRTSNLFTKFVEAWGGFQGSFRKRARLFEQGHRRTNINVTTYSANAFGPNLIGKKARGIQSAPTSVLNNDALLNLSANGYGATGFAAVDSAVISMRANENWTDTAQGSVINFSTTANGTTGPIQRMTIGSNGNVGIGVFGAQANLEVSNANNASGAGMIFATTFTTAGTSLFVGRRARGTGIAPTAVLAGDNLAGYLAQGYGATGFSGTRGGMFVRAAENWTDTAQGTSLAFNTTSPGTNTPSTRMVLDPFGNLGLGGPTNPNNALEITRSGADSTILLTSFGGSTAFVGAGARGTSATPTAAQLGDPLAVLAGTGYGTTNFSDVNAAVGLVAAENFTDTAHGTAIGFLTTPTGSITPAVQMALLPNGNLGVGTPLDVNGFPTATDKAQFFGDVRVGNAGTNGCIKNFAGTGIIGTCVSDRRFKKNITPFGATLDRLTALQPVHYFWRASEFPEHHFGDAQAYGLIAQDVEQVLPELVVTGEDGFKQVDYSKLPLLTIQAVKELKEENEALKQRVAELERLFLATRTTGARH